MSVSVKLTYVQKQYGHFLKNRELVLYINNKRYDVYLPYIERVSCLKNAIEKFDNDLQSAADTFKNNPYGAFLWLYTPDFIRGEEISGLFRLIYILEIINHINQKEGIQTTKVCLPLNKNTKKYLKRQASKVKFEYHKIFINKVHICLQNTKELYKTHSFNFKCLFKKPNSPFGGNLIDTSSQFKKNRYDDINEINRIFRNKVKYYSGDQIEVNGCNESKTVLFKRELNLKTVVISLMQSIKINRFIKKNRGDIPQNLYDNHTGLNKLLLYWDLLMTRECMHAYFKKSNIKYIVQVSTLTKPIYRSLIEIAQKHGVQYIQVASRSLTKLRCSERLIKADIENYNETALPNRYIFKDEYSTKILESFPHLKEKTYVGARFLMKNKSHLSNEKKTVALLILFNHRKDVSFKLLNIVKQLDLIKNIDHIIYRCHPNFIFEKNTIQNAFPQLNIIDNTSKSYSILEDYRTIAISGPTTAALEAINYGAIVHWYPEIYDDSILMDEVMDQIGIKCTTEKILQDELNKIYLDENLFFKTLSHNKEILMQYFNTKNRISEVIRNLIPINE